MSHKTKVIYSFISGVTGALIIMVAIGNKGLYTPFKYPEETFIFACLIFFTSIIILNFKSLWSRFRNLPLFAQIILIYPISLSLVLVREFFDSGFRFYIREATFYDSACVFLALLIGLKLLGKDLDKSGIAFPWKIFIMKTLLFIALSGILFAIYFAILLASGVMCFGC